MGSSPAPDSDGLTRTVVRAAFLARLVCLLVALGLALDDPHAARGTTAVLLLTATSAAGLYLGDGAVALLRRHPVVVALDVVAATAATALVGVGSGLVYLGLTTALLIGLLLRRRDAALLGSVLVLGFLAAVSLSPAAASSATVVVVPLADAALVWLGATVARLHELALQEQRTAADARAAAAAEHERARLAREMHDSVATSLHGISLAAAGLQGWLDRDPAAARERAGALAAAADQAARDARALLDDLRRDHEDRPLMTLVGERTRAFEERTGTAVELLVDGVADVDGPARAELLAVLDEALHNVERHARASRVRVALTGTAGSIVLDVEDDGRGLDHGRSEAALREGRYGLLGMRERADGLGGSLSLGPAASGRGTRVVLSAPRRGQVPA